MNAAKTNSLWFFALGWVLLSLCGCGPVKMPNVSSYTISSLHGITVPSKTRTLKTLLVSLPIAAPGYGTSDMLYVMIPYKLKKYAKHRWVAPPAEMLMPLIAQRIRAKGYFKAVVTSPSVASADYRLDTQLLVLQQEFLEPESEVRLVMQVTLTRSSDNHVMASRRFAALVKAPDNNPYSGVIATNKATAQVSQQIANFVIRQVSAISDYK